MNTLTNRNRAGTLRQNAATTYGDCERAGSPLIVVLDDEPLAINPEIVREPVDCSGLLEACIKADAVIVDLRHVLAWHEETRRAVLRFVGELARRHGSVTFCARGGGTADDVLSACLSHCDSQLSRLERDRAISAAVEAAAYSSLDDASVETACATIAAHLRANGGNSPRVTTLVTQARKLIREAEVEPQDVASCVRVCDVLPDAPCPEETAIPPGWILMPEGIASPKSGNTPLVPAPVILTRRLTNVDGGEQSVEIAWFRNGIWSKRIVGRGTIATARTIVELAAFDVPVTSTNASALVDFLLDFEVSNLDAIPQSLVSNRMGWIGANGSIGFLCGNELIPTGSGEVATDNSRVTFLGADVGDQQLVDGLHKAGTMEGWREAMVLLSPFARARLAICSSLATPLLMILDTPNFVVSYAGATSQGKTTTLRAAASCWGLPDERSPKGVIGTWDATAVSLERTMAARDCVPMITDDTKRARRPQDIAQIIYAVTSGRGRARGTTRGLAGSSAWHTMMLTSGESPLTSFTEDGGTRARVLEMWGSPYGERSVEAATIAIQLNQSIQEHYGHAGPQFVRALLAMRHEWDGLREDFRTSREMYQRRAGTNSVAGRMAAHFAVLHLAEELACLFEIVPWSNQETVATLWDELTAETSEADRAAAALRHVYGWCLAHKLEFIRGNHISRDGAPLHGWAGRWIVPGTRNSLVAATAPSHPNDCLAIFPHCLETILTERGFEPAAIRRLWLDRGWLRFNDGKSTLKVRMGDDPIEMVAIRWTAIFELTGGEEAAA